MFSNTVSIKIKMARCEVYYKLLPNFHNSLSLVEDAIEDNTVTDTVQSDSNITSENKTSEEPTPIDFANEVEKTTERQELELDQSSNQTVPLLSMTYNAVTRCSFTLEIIDDL